MPRHLRVIEKFKRDHECEVHMRAAQGYPKVTASLLVQRVTLQWAGLRSRGKAGILGTVYKELFKIHFSNLKCMKQHKNSISL